MFIISKKLTLIFRKPNHQNKKNVAVKQNDEFLTRMHSKPGIDRQTITLDDFQNYRVILELTFVCRHKKFIPLFTSSFEWVVEK